MLRQIESFRHEATKMRKNRVILLAGVGTILVAGVLWSGCGGDDHNGTSGATITGNISAVNPPQARREGLSHHWLARLDSLVVGEAVAQATCPARHIFICATNGRDPITCEPVDSTDCHFSITLDPAGDFSSGGVSFFDDANQNGTFDQGELFAILTNQLVPLCEGTVATLNDVSANFAALTATAASVVKDPDTCAGTPTATPRATGTVTRTPSVTRTPTHVGTPGATHTPSGT